MTCTQCTFCDIVDGAAPAYIVYETPLILAFLGELNASHSVFDRLLELASLYSFPPDILPARRGHLLIIPKQHFVLLSEVPNDLAREMGSALVTVSKALTQGSRPVAVELSILLNPPQL